MPLVAELVTKLEADTKNFNRNVNDSEDKLSKFGKTAAMAGAGIALAIGTVAVAGFVKLLNIVNDTERRISHLVDTASKFDTTVGALQKLDYIAKLSGGSLGDVEAGMNKIVMSLKSLDAGSESTIKAFEKLGISQENLKGLKIDEVYLLVAERLKGVTNSTEQAKIASEIFGRTWSSQINIVKSDLSGLSKEFDSFGGTLTDKQAAAVDSYGDSVTKLSAVFDTFKIQLTAQVAPALEGIVNWINKTTIEMGGLGPIANTVAQYFVSGIQLMVSAVQGLIDIFQALELKMLQTISIFTKAARIGTLGLSSITGEKLLGIDLGVIDSRIEEIKKRNQEGGITAPIQSGLGKVQDSLQQQQQRINVHITTEKGLKAEVAESPEVTAQINELIQKYAEASN
jgi:hypothetical protein